MKKIYTLFAAAFLFAGAAGAQTTLTTAVDFTATDINGNTFNLFNKLDEGKHVVIDFFFTTCGPCQQTAPKFHEAFMNYGSNSPNAQIYFVSINRDDNNAVFQTWEATHMSPTGPYPRGISGTQGSATGGPQTFASVYGVSAYPTMILIAPNRSILEQDMWPISTAADFTTYFQSHGLNPMPSSLNALSNEENLISVYPNPVADNLNITVQKGIISNLEVVNILGEVVSSEMYSSLQTSCILETAQLSPGTYFARVQLADKSVLVTRFIKK